MQGRRAQVGRKIRFRFEDRRWDSVPTETRRGDQANRPRACDKNPVVFGRLVHLLTPEYAEYS
jgi:hypothetical protein